MTKPIDTTDLYNAHEHITDQYTDSDGLEITCKNCDVTAREWFEQVLRDKQFANWFAGQTWYCSEQCYNEATKYE